jgi:hypothetical protein
MVKGDVGASVSLVTLPWMEASLSIVCFCFAEYQSR